MATRSTIAIKYGNIVKAVYCHWDGYLDNNGRILLEHYGPVKTAQLIALGDLASLRKEIGEKHSPDTNDGRNNGWCTFYSRDYNENESTWRFFQSESAWLKEMLEVGCMYFYLLDNNVWYVSEGEKFIALHEAIEIYDAEEAE